jgi:anti-sigma-K factor RskA
MTDRRRHQDLEALIADARTEGLEPREAEELSLLAELLGDPSTWAEPTAGLEDSVLQAVLDASPADEHVDAPRIDETRAAREQRAGARRRPRLMLSLLAAAAAVAIVVGAVAVVRREPHAMFKSRLTATALAPAAHASAEVYRNAAGFHVTLDASGLAKLPNGEYYQAWLKNSSNVLVPIGSFSSSDGKVTLWSGVSPREFNTMSVTIEATDGNQASSGKRVLVGAVLPN